MALEHSNWFNPGSDILKNVFGENLPNMEIYEDLGLMKQVTINLDRGGYVDDPQFCLVRSKLSANQLEKTLIYENILVLGVSTRPGEDVFIVLNDDESKNIFIFDWSRPIPSRWVRKTTLPKFIQLLEK